MVSFDSGEGLDDLPRRIFLEGERRPDLDDDGFVRSSGESLLAEDLLASTAILAVAPPWTGKSFVARQLEASLKGGAREGSFCSPEFVERTSFEERAPRLRPLWWDRWKDGDQRACWIVDAIDEDERHRRDQVYPILELIESLPESSRTRLFSIFFVRISDIPKAFDERIGQLFGTGLKRVRLTGLDREAAKTLVGAEQFGRICALLRDNGLREVAALPPVLLHLLDLKGEAVPGRLDQEAVWRGILKNLLREQPHRYRPSPSEVEIEDSFKVAQRLAAIVTFCGHQEISEPPRPGTLELEEAFPAADREFRILRQAGREVVKSAVFEPSGKGFRFSQDHVREWFAAFALQEMRLPALCPLLVDGSGQPSHREIMRILALISRDAAVRAWVLGITLRELDQLQEVARRSPRGLRLWQAERLSGFKLAGMGAEIARRLDLDLHPAEQQLLLDLALMLDAAEAVAPAVRILQDGRRDERILEPAASLVAALGTAEHLAQLAPWLEALQEDLGKAALSTLALAFYEQGLWTFEKAAERALSERSLHSNWLQYQLADALTLDRARWLLGHSLLPNVGHPLPNLPARALEKIQEEGLPEKADVELLFPLLRHPDWEVREQILQFLKGSTEARRTLFHKGLTSDPQREGEAVGAWRSVLNGEDAEWLLALFRARKDRPTWLFGKLYAVAHLQGVPQVLRRRIRQTLRDTDVETLKAFDEDRKSIAESNQKWRQTRREKTEKAPIYQLAPLVRETLDSEEIELRHKMLRLSWYCFESSSRRPSNLSGRWEDLPADLRDEVMAICREALAQCPPTDIPSSSSYSRSTNREAACFDRLANEDSGFVLTPEMIRKWLPALLRTWVTGSGYEPTLRRCFEVDRQLTEDLFAGAVHRAVLAEKSTYVLQNLPSKLWSERFSGLLEAIVADPNVSAEMRIDLLARIGDVFPLHALPMAQVWAQAPDASLREAGIDMLLMLAPEEGWERLKTLADRENAKEVLRRMRSLHHYGPSAAFSSWPATQLAELTELLLSCFPPQEDLQWEEGQVRSLGEDDDLRSVRDHIPQILYRRDGEGDRAILEALAARHRYIREWLDDVQAQQGAESVIAGLGRGAWLGEGTQVPLSLMMKLLQDTRSRLLRTTDDLLNVVLEEIQQIQVHARQHLSMLYRPQPLKKGEKRERLHEDALQAYIACRLADRLPYVLGEKGLKVEPAIDREPLAARNTRNDIKVQAPSIDGPRLTVIIEIKWSDNADVSTSLVDQLGEDYLLNNGLTHGLYLVGWSVPTRRWPDREACQAELAGQAQLFRQSHPELRIDPLVMDLSLYPELAPAT